MPTERPPERPLALGPEMLTLSILASALACGGPRLESPSDPAPSPSPQVAAGDDLATTGRTTSAANRDTRPVLPPERAGCPQAPTVQRAPFLRAATRLGDLADRTWVVAMAPADAEGEASRAVLLHVDSALGLVQTSLPWWSENVAMERGERPALRIIDASGGRWLRVDLSDPRAPIVGPEAPIPGLIPGEHPKAVASDGERALVSLYRRAPADGKRRYIGETFLLDVATGERIGAPGPATLWMARCASGRCFGLAEVNDDPDATKLVELGDTGLRIVADLGDWSCSGAAQWHTAEEWRVARNGHGHVDLDAINLRTGAHRQSVIKVGGDACTSIDHVSTPDGGGVILDNAASPRFFPIDDQLRPGKAQPLPARPHREHHYVRAGDSVLVVDVDAASWMQHGPPGPDGEYEYDQLWSFAGAAGLLDPTARPWKWRDPGPSPLPHDGEEGTMGDGFRPIVMSAPGQAAVLVIGGVAEPSDLVTLLGPC